MLIETVKEEKIRMARQEKKELNVLENLLKITKKTDPFTDNSVWHDPVRGVFYRRIVGGIATPAPDSVTPMSHMAILGEDREVDTATGKNYVYVLHETQAPTVEEILELSVVKQEQLKCTTWVTPQKDTDYVRIQGWMNDRRLLHLPTLRIVPPRSTDFITLHALVQGRTMGAKTMFFGEGSNAATEYVGIPVEDYYRSLKKHPALASVLYALGYIDLTPFTIARNGSYMAIEGGY